MLIQKPEDDSQYRRNCRESDAVPKGACVKRGRHGLIVSQRPDAFSIRKAMLDQHKDRDDFECQAEKQKRQNSKPGGLSEMH